MALLTRAVRELRRRPSPEPPWTTGRAARASETIAGGLSVALLDVQLDELFHRACVHDFLL